MDNWLHNYLHLLRDILKEITLDFEFAKLTYIFVPN